MYETEEGDCLVDWTYSATLSNGTPVPDFIRIYEGILIIMPHSRTDPGTYTVRVTVKNNEREDLSYTDVFTVKIESSYLV